jgi:glycosyltransferase involved in cell wall biosynthesis
VRILIISQWCTPEPDLKAVPFARELMRSGHKVEVLTGFPNYPGGNVYSGYKIRPWLREVIDGVPVVRVALYPSHDGSGVRRALNYLSYAVSAACFGPFLTFRPDVVYAYHPPPTVALPAWVYRRVFGSPVVYDIQDFWPDTLEATGMIRNRRVLDGIGFFSNIIYRGADRLVVLSPGFRRLLAQRHIRSDGIEVIYNWCDDRAIARCEPDAGLAREWGMDTGFNLVFAGNMGPAQDLDTVLNAAAVLLKRGESRIRFVMIGGGVDTERLRARVSGEKLTNVVFVPRQPQSVIARFLALADALLVHLKDDPLFAITIPSKTQAYLAVGKPVLMAVRGDAADLVRRAEAGVTCEPGNPEALADAASAMAALSPESLVKTGANAARFYREELSLAVGASRFEELFQSLTGDDLRV